MQPSQNNSVTLLNEIEKSFKIYTYMSVLRGAPTHIAIKQGAVCISYTQLIQQARLASAHISPNTVIATSFANCVENVISFLAITSAGSTVAPLNPEYSVKECEYYLTRACAGGLVVMDGQAQTSAQQAAERLGVPVYRVKWDENKNCLDVKSNQGVVSPLLKNGLSVPVTTALLLYTSGTTGDPKAVPLSHANLIESGRSIIGTYELRPTDVTYAVMPLFHIHGLVGSLIATLLSGGTVVLPLSGKFSSSNFFKELIINKCTWYSAVPTIHRIVLEVAGADVRPSLRFVRSCSAPMAPSLMQRLNLFFKVPIVEAYAMTEAAHQMTSNPLRGVQKPGSVGVPHGSVRIAVVSEEGQMLSVNRIGEICAFGPNVMTGYLGDVGRKSGFLPNGFFQTGDLGYIDNDGYLFITGRIKEMINKGGEKIAPVEIDTLLLNHPSVAEAVTFGMPNEKYGEVVAVAIVLKNSGKDTVQVVTSNEIVAFLKDKIALFKLPHKIFIANAIPKTATGKVQRNVVAKHFLNSSKL